MKIIIILIVFCLFGCATWTGETVITEVFVDSKWIETGWIVPQYFIRVFDLDFELSYRQQIPESYYYSINVGDFVKFVRYKYSNGSLKVVDIII